MSAESLSPERLDGGGDQVLVDQPDHCVACHSCELACSFHHLGLFRPSRSSVLIERDADSGVIDRRLCLVDDGERIACDHCRGEIERQCEKYCARPAVRRITEARSASKADGVTPHRETLRNGDDGTC